jgi:putative phosphoesterase
LREMDTWPSLVLRRAVKTKEGNALMVIPQNYRIGVIADTHDKWLPQIAKLFQGVDEIWHLGDVCHETILDELRVINPKLTVVLGNNDFSLDSPISLDLKRGEERFHLIHILPRRMPPDSDWLLFGHTHRAADERHNGVHLFNPGSAGRANKGSPLSVGFLAREKGGKFKASVVLL